MARYAIGDVHGCVKSLIKLVEEGIKLNTDDELFLLGDLVNKGPDSKGVLDYILKLRKGNYRVTSIRGNHDQMMLDAYYGKIAQYWTSEHAEPKTLKSFGIESIDQVSVQYLDFIRDMPFFIELEHCFLVHAGFNFEIGNPFQDIKAMLYLRKFVVDPSKIKGKILIHGHVPKEWNEIQNMAKSTSREINLDSGCVYYLNEGLGNLIGMDLDTFKLYKQENIDKPYPIDIKREG